MPSNGHMAQVDFAQGVIDGAIDELFWQLGDFVEDHILSVEVVRKALNKFDLVDAWADFVESDNLNLLPPTPPSPAPDSPSASGTPAEVDGQSSGPKSARADSVGGAS